MKNRIIAILLVFCLIVCFSLIGKFNSYADPVSLTASQVGAAALSVGSSLGIDWQVTGVGNGFIGNWIGTEVERYDNGESLIEAVSESIYMDAAGKLVITQIGYNKICEFVEWLQEKYDISNKILGTNNMVFDPQNIAGSLNGWAPFPGGSVNANNYFLEGWSQNGARPSYAIVNAEYYDYSGLRVSYLQNIAYAYYDYVAKVGGSIRTSTEQMRYTEMGLTSIQRQNFQYPSEYALPTVLYPDKEWSGTIGDHSVPDTNLGDLLDGALEDVEGGNLLVEGEIKDIDPPSPPPTPAPIDPDTPLQDVPWEGLDNNLQQLYEQGLEEIGTIGDARDAITGAIGDQTGVIEDALSDNAGVVSGAIDQAVSDVGTLIGNQTGAIGQSIADNAGVVSGAIDQAVSDVQTAIGEQTAALDESLSATAEGVETIAEAIEDEEINWRKFDLKGLFPFCIPFDIYNMLKALDASPTAPHVQLPFVIQSIGFSYMLDLDFSAFDPVAAIMRQMELICYGLALAWATSKVIKW